MDPVFRMLFYSEIYHKNSTSHHAMMTLSKNLDQIANHSIDQIADLCNTNAMSISRLVRKIGYHNFSEFRIAMENTVSQYHYLNRNIPLHATDSSHPAESFLDYTEKMISTIRNSNIFEQIDKICPLLHQARHVHYYGPPFQSLYIIMLLYDLMMDKKEIHSFTSADNIKMDLDSITEHSVLLLEPNPLATDIELCRSIISHAHKKNAAVILFDNDHSELVQYSPDHNLIFPGDHTASSVLALEFVLNMLTMEYRARYLD